MKLIVLYGLPAVGKLTVAREVSKLTGFNVFHNHLSFDLVSSVLKKKDDFFWKAVRKVRFDMFKLAAKKEKCIITTACYLGKESDMYFKPLISLAKKEKITLKFVNIFCSEKELLKRVCEDSRKSYGKLTCPKKLKKDIDNVGIQGTIPYVKSLEIDNTKLSSKKVAKSIVEKLKL